MTQECDETRENFAFRKRWVGRYVQYHRTEFDHSAQPTLSRKERIIAHTTLRRGKVVAIQEVDYSRKTFRLTKRRPTGMLIIQPEEGGPEEYSLAALTTDLSP